MSAYYNVPSLIFTATYLQFHNLYIMRWDIQKKRTLSDVNVACGVNWRDKCILLHISKQNFPSNHAFILLADVFCKKLD